MKKRVVFIIGAAALLGLFTYVYNFLQSPAVGVVTPAQTQSNSEPESEDTAPLHAKGSYISFDYPAVYTTSESRAPGGGIIERFNFLARIGVEESRRISISVRQNVNGEDIMNNSAYQFRQNESRSYVKSTEEIEGEQVEKFKKKDSSEVTYFYPGEGKYAVIAGTSTNNKGQLDKDVAVVVRSLKWQK